MFDLDVVHVERAAEEFGSHSGGGDFQQAVELMGFSGGAIVQDGVDAGSAGEKLNKEGLRLDRIICVVGFHAFVVFRKDGVADCEFSEHWVSHSFDGNQFRPRHSANKVIPPSRLSPSRLSMADSGSKPIQT